jgi:hypothetical protein
VRRATTTETAAEVRLTGTLPILQRSKQNTVINFSGETSGLMMLLTATYQQAEDRCNSWLPRAAQRGISLSIRVRGPGTGQQGERTERGSYTAGTEDGGNVSGGVVTM